MPPSPLPFLVDVCQQLSSGRQSLRYRQVLPWWAAILIAVTDGDHSLSTPDRGPQGANPVFTGCYNRRLREQSLADRRVTRGRRTVCTLVQPPLTTRRNCPGPGCFTGAIGEVQKDTLDQLCGSLHHRERSTLMGTAAGGSADPLIDYLGTASDSIARSSTR